MKPLKIAGISVAALLFVIVLAGLMMPQKPRSEQIHEGCRREYGASGSDAVSQCELTLLTKELQDQDAAKLKRAAQ